MTTAKDSHNELPLVTLDEARRALAAGFTESDDLFNQQMEKNAEFHDAHIREHLELMRGTEALHVDLVNAPLDFGAGEIIHLEMDPYLVKLRELHEAAKVLKKAWEEADHLGDLYKEICAMNRIVLALETE